MTDFLDTPDGRLGYDSVGDGPLVVLAHGMGDNRRVFREMAALLAESGYRAVSVDLRGHGDSGTGWPSYTRTDTAGDLLALIRHLGGPAVVVGHSFAGGSATIAAALEPTLVSRIVEIAPFTRAQKLDAKAFRTNARYRKGTLLLLGTALFRSPKVWKRYLDHAYPGTKPAGYAEHVAALDADLRRPGRMAVIAKMGMSAPTDAGAQLGAVTCPALVVEGTLDPDWPDPRREGEAIVAAMPPTRGHLHVIDGAGHYPHAQFPAETTAAVLDFLDAEPQT
ncbi:alpha/beta fold hydrolase [Yinghuangia sp. YIM S09857]|uniref:alpha/beta fold hydrolase n=1 Tax=Yinghuangia sp. YIM S09857 TaxID=3436929 RepID=UPI003F53B6CA